MKRFLIIIACLLITTFFSENVFAVTQTPTPDEKNPISDQINTLKDRIASRVAQLNLVERKGVIGIVTETTGTQITLSDKDGNIRFVDVDELTKFASPAAKESFGISDIAKDSKVGILGLYNKQSRRILARFVDVISNQKVVSGKTSEIDPTNFTFDVTTQNGKTFTIDVETTSKMNSYTEDNSQQRFGFSKLEENQRVIVTGEELADKKNRISAWRIVVFPDLSTPVATESSKNDLE